jgi:hypothetical protein
MINFKSCERCKGDVAQTSDWYGENLQCMQCGWAKDVSGDLLAGLIRSVIEPAREAALANRKAS